LAILAADTYKSGQYYKVQNALRSRMGLEPIKAKEQADQSKKMSRTPAFKKAEASRQRFQKVVQENR
jgi:ACT domain-containing protein